MQGYLSRPLKLMQNKIVRYPGGREIDKFRGHFPAEDDGRGEAWIGSDTATVESGEDGYDGCAEAYLPNGKTIYVKDLIERYPAEILGKRHVANAGKKMGVLVKLLDPSEQLEMQTHPTRKFAKQKLNSSYGKEEAWIILDTRKGFNVSPYVLLGFKEGITRAKFEALYRKRDVESLEALCHKIPVAPGDAFMVNAGVPHAVGGGCLVFEVQESSDFTFGITQPDWLRGKTSVEKNRLLLDSYCYEGRTYEENLRKHKLIPECICEGEWGREDLLIGSKNTSYFTCVRLQIKSETMLRSRAVFQIMLLVEGNGYIVDGDNLLVLKKGDEFLIPAKAEEFQIVAEEEMLILLAFPGNENKPNDNLAGL